MGGLRLKDKQAIADEVDAALFDLGFDRVQVSELKKDYIFFAKFDVFQTFDAIVDVAIKVTRNRIDASVVPKRESVDPLSVLPNVMFREFCQKRIPEGLTEQATEILRRFANSVADIIDDCERTGRVSTEAMKLIEAYKTEDRAKVYDYLFSKNEQRS